MMVDPPQSITTYDDVTSLEFSMSSLDFWAIKVHGRSELKNINAQKNSRNGAALGVVLRLVDKKLCS